MELEIKLMWCRGLTSFNFFQKLAVYTSVSLITTTTATSTSDSSDQTPKKLTPEQRQEQRTPVDQDGDGDPEWNHTMKFDLRSLLDLTNPNPNPNNNFNDFSLLFEIKHNGQFFGDKNLGEVRVPLRDLIESVGVGVPRFVSYEVRTPDGKPNGVLDFSYKIIDHSQFNHHHHHHHLESEIQISGYNLHHHHHHHDYHYHHKLDEYSSSSPSLSNPGKIQYPKIESEDWIGSNVSPSAPPLPDFHAPPPPPPSGPPMWAPPQPYPPPQPQPHATAYGDAYGGYYYPRPPPSYEQSSGGGYYGYGYGHGHW